MNIGIVNDMPLAVEAMHRTIARRPEHRVLWVDCVEIIWVAILSQSAAGKDKGEAEGGNRLRRKAA